MNIVDRIGKKQMEKALAQRAMPEFGAGDTPVSYTHLTLPTSDLV